MINSDDFLIFSGVAIIIAILFLRYAHNRIKRLNREIRECNSEIDEFLELGGEEFVKTINEEYDVDLPQLKKLKEHGFTAINVAIKYIYIIIFLWLLFAILS